MSVDLICQTYRPYQTAPKLWELCSFPAKSVSSLLSCRSFVQICFASTLCCAPPTFVRFFAKYFEKYVAMIYNLFVTRRSLFVDVKMLTQSFFAQCNRQPPTRVACVTKSLQTSCCCPVMFSRHMQLRQVSLWQDRPNKKKNFRRIAAHSTFRSVCTTYGQ